MGNEYYNNSVTVTRTVAPPPKKNCTLQIPNSNTYSDMELPFYYYGFPTLNLGLILTFICIVFIIAAIQFVIFISLAVLALAVKKKTYKCEKCGTTFKMEGNIKPEFCKVCGASLAPPKCP